MRVQNVILGMLISLTVYGRAAKKPDPVPEPIPSPSPSPVQSQDAKAVIQNIVDGSSCASHFWTGVGPLLGGMFGAWRFRFQRPL
jgi:hypothetical protein